MFHCKYLGGKLGLRWEPARLLQRSLGPLGPEIPKKSRKCFPGPPAPAPRKVSPKSLGNSLRSLRRVSGKCPKSLFRLFPKDPSVLKIVRRVNFGMPWSSFPRFFQKSLLFPRFFVLAFFVGNPRFFEKWGVKKSSLFSSSSAFLKVHLGVNGRRLSLQIHTWISVATYIFGQELFLSTLLVCVHMAMASSEAYIWIFKCNPPWKLD